MTLGPHRNPEKSQVNGLSDLRRPGGLGGWGSGVPPVGLCGKHCHQVGGLGGHPQLLKSSLLQPAVGTCLNGTRCPSHCSSGLLPAPMAGSPK